MTAGSIAGSIAERHDRQIALVTDWTASMAAETVAELGITVVSGHVIVGATAYDDGVASPVMVATAPEGRTPVSTSRPNPARFLET